MASIENRSQFVVTVQNREDLTKTFAYTREKQLKSYLMSACKMFDGVGGGFVQNN